MKVRYFLLQLNETDRPMAGPLPLAACSRPRRSKDVGRLCARAMVLSVFVSLPLAGKTAEKPSEPERVRTAGNYSLTVKVEERTRRYIAHAPPSYDGKKSLPVVIMLHGGGGTAKNTMVETGWTAKADRVDFLAVFPEGTPPDPSRPARFPGNPQTWNDGSGRFYSGEEKVDDVGFVNELIDDLIARFNVDRRRVYVTGFSNGASMAFRLGVELGNRIAAIAPVSGYMWLKRPKLDHPVPLLYIIGSGDPLVPLDGGRVKLPWGKVEQRPPARESVETWVEMLDCPRRGKSVGDREGVKIKTYGPGKSGSEVVFYVVEDMGHSWPGGKRLLPERIVGKTSNRIRANDVIWEFFMKHPKK